MTLIRCVVEELGALQPYRCRARATALETLGRADLNNHVTSRAENACNEKPSLLSNRKQRFGRIFVHFRKFHFFVGRPIMHEHLHGMRMINHAHDHAHDARTSLFAKVN